MGWEMGTAGIGDPSCGLSWSVLGKGVGGLFRRVGMDGWWGFEYVVSKACFTYESLRYSVI